MSDKMTESFNPNQNKSNQIADHSQIEYRWDTGSESSDMFANTADTDHFKTIDVISFIKQKCNEYTGNNPLELAVEIMNNPIIRMHGGEHHYLTPAVLLTVYNNLTNKFSNKLEKLDELEQFIAQNAPKSCSLDTGTCGAAIGAGVFFANFMQDSFAPEVLERLSDNIRTESIRQIDEIGLSRCCKRDTYISLEVTSKVLRDHLDLNIIMSDPKCTFSLRNKSCGLEDCPFYNLSNSIG